MLSATNNPISDTSAMYYTYINYVEYNPETGEEKESSAFILLSYVIISQNISADEVDYWIGPRFPYPFLVPNAQQQVSKDEQLDSTLGVWIYNREIDFYTFSSHTSHFVREFDDDNND